MKKNELRNAFSAQREFERQLELLQKKFVEKYIEILKRKDKPQFKTINEMREFYAKFKDKESKDLPYQPDSPIQTDQTDGKI